MSEPDQEGLERLRKLLKKPKKGEQRAKNIPRATRPNRPIPVQGKGGDRVSERQPEDRVPVPPAKDGRSAEQVDEGVPSATWLEAKIREETLDGLEPDIAEAEYERGVVDGIIGTLSTAPDGVRSAERGKSPTINLKKLKDRVPPSVWRALGKLTRD
jgi:hypothetical protein